MSSRSRPGPGRPPAKNPHFHQRFIDCVYQPQLELLDFLRANGFQTYIVSGGGIDLMRTFAEEVYGVPPSQVVGSSAQVTYSLEDGVPTLTKQPKVDSVDDKEGKPVNIYLHIGQKPILAFGNSDGDQQMLEYTTSGDGPSLALIVHHDDAVREFAYDRDSHIGTLNTAWDEAVEKGLARRQHEGRLGDDLLVRGLIAWGFMTGRPIPAGSASSAAR